MAYAMPSTPRIDEKILQIAGLHVRFATPDGEIHAVRGLDMSVTAGQTIALVGESGSGKSQAMMAVMGLLAQNGNAQGSVRYRDEELLGLSPRLLNKYRGVRLAMIFQEPMTSLDPLYTIRHQIVEPLRHHQKISHKAALKRARELLDLVQIPDAERRLRSYPHELSGGQRQRVMIAMAIANNPDILIADEPTTALDVTIQAEILSLLMDLQQRLGMAIIFITHDLGIVKRIADYVYVMRTGEVVEQRSTTALFANPQHSYTNMLINAEPAGRKSAPPLDSPAILVGHDIEVSFKLREQFWWRKAALLKAVQQVNITLHQQQTIGIVGESGSGKSTLAKALLRLLPSTGAIIFIDKEIHALDRDQLRLLRREIQIVFQDPFGSLSPRMTAGQVVSEGLLVHEPHLSAGERDRRAAKAFAEVDLDPSWRNRYPHEFSGGQRQRIAIARAIILKPKVIILDEPTSALDRSVQKQIVNLLRKLQSDYGLSYLFISHDLAVVRAMADRIIVMKSGLIVEQGPTETVFTAPQQDYTKQLLAAALT